MEPFNNKNQSQVTGTSNSDNMEPSTDFTQEKKANGFGRSTDKTKPNNHLQSEDGKPEDGGCFPWATLLSRAISKTAPQDQLKNQHPPVINMSASDFKLALDNDFFSGFQGQVMVADDLNLQGINKSAQLPEQLYVQGKLNLSNAKTERFPSKLYVGGELNIDGCSHFPAGCQQLEVGSNLDLSGNPDIKNLPEQVHVAGSLILNDCKNLQMLSKKLYVGKDLQVQGCYNLKKIPPNTKVAGNLDFTDCIQLLLFPDTILQRPSGQNTDNKRHIYCHNTLIRLNKTSQAIAKRENTAVHLKENGKKTLQIIRSWMKKNGSFHKAPNLNLTPNEDQELSTWLKRMPQLKEYKVNKKDYRNRIINILNEMANEAEFQTYFFNTLDDTMSTCDDRATLGVDDLEIRIFLSEANKLSEQKSPASENKLKLMGGQMLRHGLLDKYFLTGRNWYGQDDIEDMLYLKIHLKDALNLPVNFSHMDAADVAVVKKRDLEFAKKFIEERSTPKHLSEFLQTWEPWQRYHQLGRFNIPKYDELTQCPRPDTDHQECAITWDTRGDMVYAEGQSYNYDALVEWGRKNGTLPHIPSKTIDWKNVQRWRSDDNSTDNDEVT